MFGQAGRPVVAVHDSEYTRALENMNASGATPTGSGTTGKQWWPTTWHYHVMPESVKEMFRADGTAFAVVGDSNIIAGDLLVNGQPRYPIVISLAAEAIRNEEIAQFTNYVAAGGFLFVGSSSFTRNTNGTGRGNFAIANEMGVTMTTSNLNNWGQNNYFQKQATHRITSHIPSGGLNWDMPSGAEEISWGISPSHPFAAPHPAWQVQASTATVLAFGDTFPVLLMRPFGKGYFIYHAAMQPIVAHGGWSPGMYAYMLFRKSIEWAFESAQKPIPKVSPWPYQYDAAFIVRHDLENYANLIEDVEPSAQFEAANGVRGDYYFCTGTLREDMPNKTAVVASLRSAVTNYGATLGPHNGGLKNPRNNSLTHADYDYWHWGPDEAFDVTPSGYSSGKAYAQSSLSTAFQDVEGWLSGIPNLGPRNWCVPYFNGTRDDAYDIQVNLNVKITGEQKISPFPHLTLGTKTSKYYPLLQVPVSDWYVGNQIAQSMGEHDGNTLRAAIDYYYANGLLINFYSHAMSDYGLPSDYITYSMSNSLHPRLWNTNHIGLYGWWLQRSNMQMVASYATNGNSCTMTLAVSGAANPNAAVEVLIPGPSYSGLQVQLNGALAGGSSYRTNGQLVHVRVGTSVTNVVINYQTCTLGPYQSVFSQNFDGVSAPNLPPGWTSSSTGAQSGWTTSSAVRDTVPNAGFSAEAAAAGISELTSPNIAISTGQSQLAFRQSTDMEAGWDGGVLELKIGAGAFTDIAVAGGVFVNGGYTHALGTSSGNSLGGRQAWSGNSGGFFLTVVDLPAAAIGQSVQFRWRCATDSNIGGNGWRVDTISISNRNYACITGVNTNAPVLPAQTNRIIAEFTPLTVVNTAADADASDILSYTLLAAPATAMIDSQGIISWTPGEGFGGTVNTFTTRVTDNGSPQLSATNAFTVTVIESNSGPVLPNQSNRSIAEGTVLNVTNAATDPDVPPNALTYALLAAPAGASIDSQGIISWPTTESTGPSTNVFTTQVTDNGTPALSATNSFTVIVTEVNSAPVLPAQTDRTIAGFTTLTLTNSATDSDLPANTLNYLLAIAPAGATISSSGVIDWTPGGGGSTNLFRTVVTDNGSPPLSATNNFTVTVVATAAPTAVLDSTALITESCVITNNAIDPGEQVTINFAFRNIGAMPTTNLVITLLGTGGIVGPTGPQNYGVLISGDSPVSRSFSFTAAGSCGGSITASLQMQDGLLNLGTATADFQLGTSGTVFTQNFDTVTAPALPVSAGWSAQSGGVAMVNWYTTNSLVDTGPNSVFSRDPGNISSNILTSPVIALPFGSSQLSFRQRHVMEADTTDPTIGFDGGVLEIKIGGGAWKDILDAGGNFVSGEYNSVISPDYGNPLGNRSAWSGTSNAFYTTVVNLPIDAGGQNIQLRWFFASDNGTGSGGWRIDSIGLKGALCCINGPPIAASPTNRTIPEQSLMTVTNTALDPGIPVASLNYSLTVTNIGTAVQATNANISSAGVITWTPTEAQGPGMYLFATIAANSSVPSLAATNTFLVTVNEVNSAPLLPTIATKNMSELSTLTVTITASDSDLPANALSYTLINPPANASINAQGIITFTPSEAQGPSTNTITTVVSDGTVNVTNPFVVIVSEVNTPPVLPIIGQKSVAELATLVVTNTASDSDLPPNVITYSLLNPPANAVINSQGVVTFTPTEAQVPSTNVITTIANDGLASATNSFVVIATEVNTAPTLPVIGQQTITELSTLTVTNTASDPDLPANELTYQLINAPSNVAINSQGIISFTPSEAQGPSTNVITTIVSDGSASATNSFTVIVTETNTPPILPVVGDQTVPELSMLTVTNTATDVDVPANTLTYSLIYPPPNVSINAEGIITFTPSEAQGPSTNTITTMVSDGSASATNSFTVIVTEVNTPPVLPVIADQVMNELTTLTITNTASDEDVVGNNSLVNDLNYVLVNPPAHASIDLHGIITFAPDETQGPSTIVITTIVSDGTATATNSFTVIVNEVNAPPSLPVITQCVMDELTVLIVTNSATDLDVPANTLTYTLVDPPLHTSIDSSGVITFAPDEAQGPSTNTITTIVSDGSASATNSFTVIVNEVDAAPVLSIQSDHVIRNYKRLCVTNTATDVDLPVGQLTYTLLNSPPNASINDLGVIVWIPNEGHCPHTNRITTVVTDSAGLSATNSFAVVVTEPPVPMIQSLTISNGTASIIWNTVPGENYRLQYKNDLSDPSWVEISPIAEADGESLMRADDISGIAQRYYRVILLP